MADPQLVTLAKHCRKMAGEDPPNAPLWTQIADEIGAWLSGELGEVVVSPDQLSLDGLHA